VKRVKRVIAASIAAFVFVYSALRTLAETTDEQQP
jgi:hypothetical protein